MHKDGPINDKDEGTTHKGVNQCSKGVTQAQQQRPELPMVTLTWCMCKYKVHTLHQRYILDMMKDEGSLMTDAKSKGIS